MFVAALSLRETQSPRQTATGRRQKERSSPEQSAKSADDTVVHRTAVTQRETMIIGTWSDNSKHLLASQNLRFRSITKITATNTTRVHSTQRSGLSLRQYKEATVPEDSMFNNTDRGAKLRNSAIGVAESLSW